MQYQNLKPQPLIKQNKTLDAKEMDRLLKRYQGIFKNSIKEFAQRNAVRVSGRKNYAR